MASTTSIDGNVRSFIAGGTIGKYELVKLDGTTLNSVVQAGKSASALARVGVALEAATSGDSLRVQLLHGSGTIPVKADKSLAVNVALYGAADGEVSDASSSAGVIIGYALNAAGAGGDIIEMLPNAFVGA